MPRKKVIKRQVKQKQKQNLKVSQNVKVIVGDVKRKQVKKSKGVKAGASAKPPIILNISNPQPYNNPYMEYFKNQLQNQQPIQANTLNEQVKIKEKQETEASKAGALGKLVQDPGKDQERELRKQRIAGIERQRQAEAEQKNEAQQIRSSLKPVKRDDPRVASTPLRPRQPTQREILMGSIRSSVPLAADTEMLSQLRQQQNTLESAINTVGTEKDDEEEPAFPQGGAGENPSTPVLERQTSKRGRPPGRMSALETPEPDEVYLNIYQRLGKFSDEELRRKQLKGDKLYEYAQQLGIATKDPATKKKIGAKELRETIIELVNINRRYPSSYPAQQSISQQPANISKKSKKGKNKGKTKLILKDED